MKAIGERLLQQFDGDHFGDFKGTLLGLLGAYSYEFSILTAASRLTTADAYRTLHTLYRARTHATETVPQGMDDTGISSTGAGLPVGGGYQARAMTGVMGGSGDGAGGTAMGVSSRESAVGIEHSGAGSWLGGGRGQGYAGTLRKSAGLLLAPPMANCASGRPAHMY